MKYTSRCIEVAHYKLYLSFISNLYEGFVPESIQIMFSELGVYVSRWVLKSIEATRAG